MLRLIATTAVCLLSCPSHSSETARPRPAGKESPDFRAAPVVSIDAPVVSFPWDAQLAFTGQPGKGAWHAKLPTPESPAMAAVDVGRGPSRLLLSWVASGNPEYLDTTYGGPGSYRIETSADSTNGKNGTWKAVVTVTGNLVMNRAHSFDFTGQRWARLVLTGPTPKTYQYGIQLDEILLHDVSNGTDDSWIFVGDSITAEVFRPKPEHQPSFAQLVQKVAPAYRPVVLRAGVGFFKSENLLEQLPAWLALNPDFRQWAILIGSNEPNDQPSYLKSFRRHLEAIVTQLQAAGKRPILARIPFCTRKDVRNLNEQVDVVVKKFKLHPGPDLYAWFKAHPDQLRDGLHPNDEGARSVQRLWAETMRDLYPN